MSTTKRGKTSAVVHYAAHGVGSLAFECYLEAMRAHHAAEKIVTYSKEESRQRSAALKAVTPKMPARHTDLSKVTCRQCWRSILAMVSERGI